MNRATHTLNAYWKICLFALAGTFAVMVPDFAFALSNTPMGNVLCTVANWFTGNTGKGLATIAVTVIGIGALLGKVSWGMAMIVGIGVAIIFGAASIVTAMGGGTGVVLIGAGNSAQCA